MIAGVEARSQARVGRLQRRPVEGKTPRGWRALAASWAAAVVFHAGLFAAAATLTSVLVRKHAATPDLAPVRLALGGTGAAGHDPLPVGREAIASRRPAVPDLPAGEIETGEPPRVSGAEELLAGPPPGLERASGDDPMAGHVPEHAGHGRPGAARGARWGSGESAGTPAGDEAAAGNGNSAANAPTGGGAGGPAESASSGEGGDGWARRRGGRLPAYPSAARRRGWEGTATLALEIAADGSVSAVRVSASSGHSLLDQAAEDAAWTWTFAPALRDGQAQASRVTMPVTFRLTD
ncbi:MAG: energy transducer TonB [Planctomycetota bacterium]